MRGATQCARRLKQLFRSLRTKLGKVPRPAAGDAITQMILGIFSRDAPQAKAREALDRLRAQVVDYNELRVVPPIEMTDMVGELSNARMKCEDLSRALNKVFSREHEASLARLREMSKRDVVDYLEEIDGLDAYSRARVRLLGLQQHAIPLDEAMWAYARKTAIVHRTCSLNEAQSFLERRISEQDALEFVALFEKQAWAEMGAAVRNREVERITSIPPDRTARNMLQLVASGRTVAVGTSQSTTAGSAAAGASHGGGSTAVGRKSGQPRRKTVKRTGQKSATSTSVKKRTPKASAKRNVKARPKARPKQKGNGAPPGRARAKRTVRAKTTKRSPRSGPKARSA